MNRMSTYFFLTFVSVTILGDGNAEIPGEGGCLNQTHNRQITGMSIEASTGQLGMDNDQYRYGSAAQTVVIGIIGAISTSFSIATFYPLALSTTANQRQFWL